MPQEIALFRNFGLSTRQTVSYCQSLNAFTNTGYTSLAGNHYFVSLRLSNGIIIKEDVGIGYAHTFLNGLKIYDLNSRTLLCDETYNCVFYSRQTAKNYAVDMLTRLVMKTAQREGAFLNQDTVKRRASEIVNDAYYNNQMDNLNKYTKQLGY